ncbi:MAG: class I SAM-dependent methyltransferase [Verrucomicrobia bacterium]|nr:class I SAM-dependent methyltransferase [Verrucomicrobiota bacterium]
MDAKVKNFLYRNPQYYELVYPEPNEETPNMCRRIFSRFLRKPPTSILDIGCGTGRDLDALSRDYRECWGVDYLKAMVEYAQQRRPHLRLQVGDMRTIRLGRTFDAILCMGSTFMYALSNADVEKTLETFVVHSHAGTLLFLDINNGSSYLGSDHFQKYVEFKVNSLDFSAHAVSVNSFDRPRQLLVRSRTWNISGQVAAEDFCEYRLFFPAELEHLLAEKNFRIVGIFDNMELLETDLSRPRLYVAALLKS